MAAKKSTIQSVVGAVKEAVVAVGHAADDHVIHPVGEALGLIKKPEPTGKEKKAARKSAVRAAMEKKKSPAAKTMTSGLVSSQLISLTAKTKGPELKGKRR